jgi:hypothetical protein
LVDLHGTLSQVDDGSKAWSDVDTNYFARAPFSSPIHPRAWKVCSPKFAPSFAAYHYAYGYQGLKLQDFLTCGSALA